jgi:hypothetical protein
VEEAALLLAEEEEEEPWRESAPHSIGARDLFLLERQIQYWSAVLLAG